MDCSWMILYDSPTEGNELNPNLLHDGDVVYIDVSLLPPGMEIYEWVDGSGQPLSEDVISLDEGGRYRAVISCGTNFVAIVRNEDECHITFGEYNYENQDIEGSPFNYHLIFDVDDNGTTFSVGHPESCPNCEYHYGEPISISTGAQISVRHGGGESTRIFGWVNNNGYYIDCPDTDGCAYEYLPIPNQPPQYDPYAIATPYNNSVSYTYNADAYWENPQNNNATQIVDPLGDGETYNIIDVDYLEDTVVDGQQITGLNSYVLNAQNYYTTHRFIRLTLNNVVYQCVRLCPDGMSPYSCANPYCVPVISICHDLMPVRYEHEYVIGSQTYIEEQGTSVPKTTITIDSQIFRDDYIDTLFSGEYSSQIAHGFNTDTNTGYIGFTQDNSSESEYDSDQTTIYYALRNRCCGESTYTPTEYTIRSVSYCVQGVEITEGTGTIIVPADSIDNNGNPVYTYKGCCIKWNGYDYLWKQDRCYNLGQTEPSGVSGTIPTYNEMPVLGYNDGIPEYFKVGNTYYKRYGRYEKMWEYDNSTNPPTKYYKTIYDNTQNQDKVDCRFDWERQKKARWSSNTYVCAYGQWTGVGIQSILKWEGDALGYSEHKCRYISAEGSEFENIVEVNGTLYQDDSLYSPNGMEYVVMGATNRVFKARSNYTPPPFEFVSDDVLITVNSRFGSGFLGIPFYYNPQNGMITYERGDNNNPNLQLDFVIYDDSSGVLSMNILFSPYDRIYGGYTEFSQKVIYRWDKSINADQLPLQREQNGDCIQMTHPNFGNQVFKWNEERNAYLPIVDGFGDIPMVDVLPEDTSETESAMVIYQYRVYTYDWVEGEYVIDEKFDNMCNFVYGDVPTLKIADYIIYNNRVYKWSDIDGYSFDTWSVLVYNNEASHVCNNLTDPSSQCTCDQTCVTSDWENAPATFSFNDDITINNFHDDGNNNYIVCDVTYAPISKNTHFVGQNSFPDSKVTICSLIPIVEEVSPGRYTPYKEQVRRLYDIITINYRFGLEDNGPTEDMYVYPYAIYDWGDRGHSNIMNYVKSFSFKCYRKNCGEGEETNG